MLPALPARLYQSTQLPVAGAKMASGRYRMPTGRAATSNALPCGVHVPDARLGDVHTVTL